MSAPDNPRLLAKIAVAYALIFALPATYLILFPFEGGDYYHNIWLLSNNIRNLISLQSFADANINYPVTDIGLLHELQPLNTILFAPFYAAGAYITGYYSLLYLSQVLSALVTAWLALLLGARTGAAVLIGFATGIVGYRYLHLSHIQAVSVQWMLLPFVFWLRYERDRRSLDLIAYFAFLTPLLMGPSYLGIAGGLALAIVFCCRLAILGWNFKFMAPIAIASLAAVLVTLPINLQYLQLARAGIERSSAEASGLSSDLIQVLLPPPGTWLGQYFHHFVGDHHYYEVSYTFPGFIILFATAAALILMLGKPKIKFHYMVVGAAFATVIFFFISLGPVIKLAARPIVDNPIYSLLYNVIPLLRATRFVPEFGFISTNLGLIVFAVVAAKTPAIDRRLKLQGHGVVTLLLLAAAIFLENLNYGWLRIERVASDARAEPAAIPAYRALDRLPAGPVVSLPMGGLDEYNYMYFSLYHRDPTVNGNSGFVPLLKQKLAPVLATFPSTEALRDLALLNIHYLVLHKKRWSRPVSHCADILPGMSSDLAYEDQVACVLKLPGHTDGHPAIDSYRLGDDISFGDKGNFWRFIPQLLRPIQTTDVAGWSGASSASTWVASTTASLIFLPDRTPTASNLMLEAKFETAVWPAVGRELAVGVWANETQVGEWRINQGTIHNKFSVTIPASVAVSTGNRLSIEFRVPAVPSPFDLKASDDDRHLSLLIENLRIVALPQ